MQGKQENTEITKQELRNTRKNSLFLMTSKTPQESKSPLQELRNT